MNFLDPGHYEPPPHECDEEDVICPDCHGDGAWTEQVCVGPDEYEEDTRRCATCKGSGEVPADLDIPQRWEL